MTKNNGFTLVEIMAIIIILSILVAMLLPALSQVSEKTDARGRCQPNLSQIGKGLAIYLLDLGRQVRYPQRNGQGFIAELYREKILIEPLVYLCSSTSDTNREYEIQEGRNGRLATSLADIPDSGTASGPISYAGRLNKEQSAYPGIFHPTEDITTTPIVGDDLGDPHNHENGQVMQFLFLDLHVDHIRRRNRDFSDMFSVLGN